MNLIDEIVNFIDGEIQYENCWEIRCIRFDIDLEQEEKKNYEKLLGVSYRVEDAKGNPGHNGSFYLFNLRVKWVMHSNRQINLSFGLDTITSVGLKTIPVAGGSSFKHLLTIKTENPAQNNRYSFKFIGFTDHQLQLFEHLKNIHQKILQTKDYRSTNISLTCDPAFMPLDNQQIKSEYLESILYENKAKIQCKIILTNIRIIIIKNKQKKINYGISWFMVRAIQMIQVDDRNRIALRCRGILSQKRMRILCQKEKDTKKLEYQLKSYCQTFNKAPILGMDFLNQVKEKQDIIETQVEEIQHTRINLGKRKNAYDSKANGSLFDTFYNDELGLMMQRFPEDINRQDLWQILKK